MIGAAEWDWDKKERATWPAGGRRRRYFLRQDHVPPSLDDISKDHANAS